MDSQTIDGYLTILKNFYIFRKFMISLPTLIIIGICFLVFIVLILLNNFYKNQTEIPAIKF